MVVHLLTDVSDLLESLPLKQGLKRGRSHPLQNQLNTFRVTSIKTRIETHG